MPVAEAKISLYQVATMSPELTPYSMEPTCLRIRSIVQTTLGAAVPDDQPLMEAGLDSLGAVDLRNAIGEAFHLQLPATAIFDYPTITAMSQYICSQMASGTGIIRAPLPEPESMSCIQQDTYRQKQQPNQQF